jgi:phosphoenolpyruvate carboxylase
MCSTWSNVPACWAKSGRAGNERAFSELAGVLAGMSLDEALPIARAFAQFLHLANIAEQHHRVRRRRAYQRDPDARPQRGSCEDSFARLLAAGISPERLHEAVCALHIELVLTAHPTEVARRRIVQKHNRIARALATRDRPDLTLVEREQLLAMLRREVESAWATSEVREQRPSPIDEVRSGLIVFEQSLWDAVPGFARVLDRALAFEHRAVACRSKPRRCASGRGSAVTATETPCHAGRDAARVLAVAMGGRRSLSR